MVDTGRCPLWLRLAATDGEAVSVAQALKNLLVRQPSMQGPQPLTVNDSLEYDETIDRSFLFTAYPLPGRWYLTLYAECYSGSAAGENDPCSISIQRGGFGVDVGALLRITPCLRRRCRDIGEPAALTPARNIKGENFDGGYSLYEVSNLSFTSIT